MKETLTNKQALDHLREFRKLDNCLMTERLDLRELLESGEVITFPMTLENSSFIEIYSTLITFSKLFVLKNCEVEKLDIYGTYFLNGFTIEDNTFKNLVPFMHATHGINGGQMKICRNTFHEFVDFEDTEFKNKIYIQNNDFQKGTNLLADVQLSASISKDSIISDNKGNLQIRTFLGTQI